MDDQKDVVTTLLERASKAQNAVEAMNLAQAACNAANALRAVAETNNIKKQA